MARTSSGTVQRYRVMAIVSGVMSLLLWFVYVPIAHGYLYPIYVLTAIQLSIKAKWALPKMLGFILAGTLPVASLIAERRVVQMFLPKKNK
jgi:hypothetical protein